MNTATTAVVRISRRNTRRCWPPGALALLAAVTLALAAGCGSESKTPPLSGDASDAAGGTGAGGAAEAGPGGAAGGDAAPPDASDGGCVPASPLLQRLGLGAEHGCALHADGTAECWGTPSTDLGQTQAPKGTFSDLDAFLNTNCAVSSVDGSIACWGDDSSGIVSKASTGKFLQVAVGIDEGCALSACGKIQCWGSGAAPPADTFSQITAGRKFGCAIATDGTIECWGASSYGETIPPAGKFKEISSGYSHTCGIKDDGTLACWGAGGPGTPTDGSDPNHVEWGQSVPPSGAFQHVASGAGHSCAIAADGHVECWGAGTVTGSCGNPPPGQCGQAMPPGGTFEELALGFSNSCGVKTDGSIACWGSNTGQRSTPPSDFP